MYISINWLRSTIRNLLRGFIPEEVTSDFVLKNNLAFAYDIIGKPIPCLPKLKEWLKRMILEAYKLQREIPDLVFIKTFTIIPMLHADIDVLTTNLKKTIEIAKRLGYNVRKYNTHAIVLVKNPFIELDVHFSISVLSTELSLGIKPERLRHEYYNTIVNEDVEFQVPTRNQASFIYYLGLLNSKIITIADLLEMSIVKEVNIQTLIDTYGIPKEASYYPAILSLKAYIPVIPVIMHKPNPLALVQNFIDYIKCFASIHNIIKAKREGYYDFCYHSILW